MSGCSDESMIGENIFLFHSALLGVYLSFVYDTVRILRRIISHNTFFISIEDLIYWIYFGAESFLLMYRESNGLLRWFAVLGAGVGCLLYRKLIGKYYVYYISLFLKKIICRILRFYKMRLKSGHKLLTIRLKRR